MLALLLGLATASEYQAHLFYPCGEGLSSCVEEGCVAEMDGGPRVIEPEEVSVLEARLPEPHRDLPFAAPTAADAMCREAFAHYHGLGRRRSVDRALDLYAGACFSGDHIGACHALRDLLATQPGVAALSAWTAAQAEARRDLLLAEARAMRAGRAVRFERGVQRAAQDEAHIDARTEVPATGLVEWTDLR